MPITRLANRLTTSIVILIIILGTLLFTYVYFMSDVAGPVSTNQSNVSTWVQLPSFMKSTTRSYEDPFGPLILEASNPSQPVGVAGDNEKRLWNFLIGKGYTPTSAAAIMGNIQQESGINPGSIQGSATTPWEDLDGKRGAYGSGLCQWTSPGRKSGFRAAVLASGKDWTDFDVQAEYMWFELLTGYTSCLPERLNTMTDISAATQFFEVKFEGAGKPLMDKRIRYANEIYQRNIK